MTTERGHHARAGHDAGEEQRPRSHVVIGLTVLVAGVLGAWCGVRARERAFDPGRWAASAGIWGDDNPRQHMAAEVRDRLMRDRPTQEEVHALLGVPDFTGDQWERWGIGFEPRALLAEWWSLYVAYGPDGRVSTAHIGE